MRINNLLSLLIFVSLFSFQKTQAQSNTNSPYSTLGLGRSVDANSTHFKSMSGVGIGISNGQFINFSNPASYTSLELTTFEFGGEGTIATYKQGDNVKTFNSANFSQLGLGMPLNDKAALTFGILPVSHVGYDIQDVKAFEYFPSNTTDTIGYRNSFLGSGGVGSFLGGFAYQPIPNLSVGVNVQFQYGNIDKTTEKEFDKNNYLSNRKLTTYNINHFSYKLGAQYHHTLDDKRALIAGATYDIGGDKNIERSELHYTYVHTSELENTIDTVFSRDLEEGTMTLPSTFGFGLSYEIKDKLTLGIDFKQTNWSKFAIFGENEERFVDQTSIALGGSYIPNRNDVRNLWKRSTYRFGINYKTGYLNTSFPNGNDNLTEFGINFGIGLPIRKAGGTLNLGLGYSQIGSLDNAGVKEQIFKAFLSLTIRDKWFVQRKID